MIIYTGMIFWFLLIYAIGFKGSSITLEPGVIPPVVTRIRACLMMAYPVFFIGLRSKGADTETYIGGYDGKPTGFAYFLDAFTDFRGEEQLFNAFGIAIKTWISTSYHPYLFLIAAISGFALVETLRKYSAYFLTSMLIFALSSDWVWMINGIRQFLAATLAFAAFGLLIRGRTIWYIIVILILAGIHQSVLIMIPVYFVVKGQAWNWRTLAIIGLAVLALVFTARFTDFLSSATEGTSYSGVTEDEIWTKDDGANPIRFCIYAVVPALAFIKRREVQERGNQVINIYVNMSIICACISAVSVVTSGIYVGRVPIYFSLYNLILLPWLIANTWDEKKDIMMWLMLLFYTALYIYENYLTGEMYYDSDILNLMIY